MVSQDVLRKREFNFMLRDHPHDENYSGWKVFNG
ncbi:immunity protein Imm33 domain-containing protein [Bacillus altitudinis]